MLIRNAADGQVEIFRFYEAIVIKHDGYPGPPDDAAASTVEDGEDSGIEEGLVFSTRTLSITGNSGVDSSQTSNYHDQSVPQAGQALGKSTFYVLFQCEKLTHKHLRSRDRP